MKRTILVLLILTLIFVSCSQTNAQNNNENNSESPVSDLSDIESSSNDQSTTSFDISLKGRGKSDISRQEPEYVDVSGYAVCDISYPSHEDEFIESPWYLPANQNGTPTIIEHKTPVTVIKQELKHTGHGNYEGTLLVSDLNGDRYTIDVNNFITDPYWDESVGKAYLYGEYRNAGIPGTCIAQYRQISRYTPVTVNNETVELQHGFKVILVGRTGTYGKGKVDNSTHQVEAIVYKDWSLEYGGVTVFFNSSDLDIIY